jgi:hypothetical protein
MASAAWRKIGNTRKHLAQLAAAWFYRFLRGGRNLHLRATRRRQHEVEHGVLEALWVKAGRVLHSALKRLGIRPGKTRNDSHLGATRRLWFTKCTCTIIECSPTPRDCWTAASRSSSAFKDDKWSAICTRTFTFPFSLPFNEPRPRVFHQGASSRELSALFGSPLPLWSRPCR